MNIRRARVKDLPKLMSIERSSFSPQEMTTMDVYEYRIQNFPHWFFVAEEEGEIFGFITCRPCNSEVMEEEFFTMNKIPEASILAVLSMAVAARARGQGIGSRLFRHVLQLATKRGFSKVILGCREASIPYFQQYDFVTNGTCPSHTITPRHNMILNLKK